MGPFSGAPENRKYILVAIDHFSAYPTIKFVKSTDMKGIKKFLRKYISDNGIPQILQQTKPRSSWEANLKTLEKNSGSAT